MSRLGWPTRPASRGLHDVVTEWEAEHGAFSDDELAALIALDRNDRTVWAMLRVAAVDATEVSVPAGAIAQAWRDGVRQALLARALKHCDEVPLDGALARASGVLCGHADPDDLNQLINVLKAPVRIAAIPFEAQVALAAIVIVDRWTVSGERCRTVWPRQASDAVHSNVLLFAGSAWAWDPGRLSVLGSRIG